MTGMSRLSSCASTDMGWMTAARPTTPRVLKRLEPMTLPSARSSSPLRAAATDEASSGSEVPTATMVRPMIRSLTPKPWAISTAPQTSTRELMTRSARSMISQKRMGRMGAAASSSKEGAVAPSSVAEAAGAWFFCSARTVQPTSAASRTSSTMASTRVSWPSHSCQTARPVTSVSTNSSLRRTCCRTVMGLMRAVMPRMSAMLVMLEP